MITVLTATYNRASKLNDLYKSLINQTNKNFKWLLIDDGSTDNTEETINGFIDEDLISIKYVKKENGGKHTALNYSYQYIDTELTFIVDSDDTLVEDAIDVVIDTFKNKDESDVCGFSFLRGTQDGGILSRCGVPFEGIKEDYVECRINRNISGDMAEVWKTECLREYRFPEFEGEKFLGEDVVWISMAQKYKMKFFNTIIYMSGYLDDGLTNNRRHHNISSPRGCVLRAEIFLDSKAKFSVKVKAMLQYQIYSYFVNNKNVGISRLKTNKLLYFLCFIPSRIIYKKWKHKYVEVR